MTAEIAIMNRHAVVLAADSAVTVGNGLQDGSKVYNSANKLFMLSKYEPVGAMIFGNAALMSVPWETIIKLYRKKLGTKRFPKLEGYTEDFIKFIEGNSQLFPNVVQIDFLQAMAGSYFVSAVKATIQKRATVILETKNEVSVDEVKEIVDQVIGEHLQEWESTPFLPGFGAADIDRITKKYRKELDDVIRLVFEQLPLDETAHDNLRTLSALLICRDRFPQSSSGIVIAGFGEDEFFPVLTSHTIAGVVNNKLKFKSEDVEKIWFDNTVSISAFAQREMVDSFMSGIDPSYKKVQSVWLESLFKELPKAFIDSLGSISDNDKEEMLTKTNEAAQALLKDFREQTEDYENQVHVNPIVQAVAQLPKEELVLMAESLVNLTSLKRRVTLDTETVGGAVDVAVISKGDGFIWIKRKHYFEPDLNHHFFKNYYHGEGVK